METFVPILRKYLELYNLMRVPIGGGVEVITSATNEAANHTLYAGLVPGIQQLMQTNRGEAIEMFETLGKAVAMQFRLARQKQIVLGGNMRSNLDLAAQESDIIHLVGIVRQRLALLPRQ